MTGVVAGAAVMNLGTVMAKLAGMREELGFSGSESGGEYKKIPELLQALRSDLEQAIEIDKQEYEDSWTEWVKRLTDTFWYKQERKKFDEQVAKDRDEAWENFGKVETKVKTAEDFLHVPDQLKADAEVWLGISRQAEGLTSVVPGMAQVEGWSGPAAEQYATMTGVQAEACVEYSNTAAVVYESLSKAAEFNDSVLTTTYAFMQARHRENQADIQNLTRSVWTFYYKRTQAVGWRLGVLADEIDKCYGISDGAASDTAQKCDASKERAVLTHQGWPTGVSQAGVQAGDTLAADIPIGQPEQKAAQQQAASGQGVER